MDFTQLILNFLSANPHLAVIITIVSVLRAVFKPIMLAVQAYVDSQPNQSVKDSWASLLNSKVFMTVSHVIDFLTSIKLPTLMGVQSPSVSTPSDSAPKNA